MNAAFALPEGTSIAGYTVGGVLGRGGFGITYAATNRVTRRHAAIKEFYPSGRVHRRADGSLAFDEADRKLVDWALRKFEETTTVLAGLDHPGIVHVQNFVAANGTGYMFMDLVEGVSLQAMLRSRGRIEPADLAPIVVGVGDALAYVHARGIVHRDIAPDNILLRNDGRPVLIDFGALKQIDDEFTIAVSRATGGSSTFAISKRFYSAPELYRPDAAVTTAVDVYSLGAVAYRALTGEPPPDATERSLELVSSGRDPMVPVPSVDRPLAEVILGCLDLNPARRPTIAVLCGAFAGHAPAPATPATPAAARPLPPEPVSAPRRQEPPSRPRPQPEPPPVTPNEPEPQSRRWIGPLAVIVVATAGFLAAVYAFIPPRPQPIVVPSAPVATQPPGPIADTAALRAIGFDETKLRTFLGEPHGAAELAEARRRFDVIQREWSDYVSAGDDPTRLQAVADAPCEACLAQRQAASYLRTLRNRPAAPTPKSAPAPRSTTTTATSARDPVLSSSEERAVLDLIGLDETKLKAFIQSSRSAAANAEAQRRLDVIQREWAVYISAGDDVARLRAVANGPCEACVAKRQAQSYLATLANRPKPATR